MFREKNSLPKSSHSIYILCVFVMYRNMTPPMLLKLKFVCEKDMYEMQEMINEKKLAVTTPQDFNNRRRESALRKEAMLNAVQQLVSFQLQKRCSVMVTPARPAPCPLPENYAEALSAWRWRQAAAMPRRSADTVIAYRNESTHNGQYFDENVQQIQRRLLPLCNPSCPVTLVQGMTRLTLPSGQRNQTILPSGQVFQTTLLSRKVVQTTLPSGQLVQMTHPNGQVVQMTYPNGQVVQRTHPNGQVVQMTHPNGQVVQMTLSSGQVIHNM